MLLRLCMSITLPHCQEQGATNIQIYQQVKSAKYYPSMTTDDRYIIIPYHIINVSHKNLYTKNIIHFVNRFKRKPAIWI